MEIRAASVSESQVAGVSASGCPASSSDAFSAGSTRSMNSPAPGRSPATHTTPWRAESVPSISSAPRPASTRACVCGRSMTPRDSIFDTSMSQASTCTASSAASSAVRRSAGMRRSTVPGSPLALSPSVVPSSSSGATPGSRRPLPARSRCCGADCSTPSRRSTRNRSTAPASMNQAKPGSSMSTGRFPAQGTAVPAAAASCASGRPAAVVMRPAPTGRAGDTSRPRPPSARRGRPAAPRGPRPGR